MVADGSPAYVVVTDGNICPCRSVVDALSARPNVIANLPMARPDGRLPVNDYLQCRGAEHILAVGGSAGTETTAPPLPAGREIQMRRRAASQALALPPRCRLSRRS